MSINVKIKTKAGEAVVLNACEETKKPEKTSFTFGKGCDNQKELEALTEAVSGAKSEDY